MKLNDNVMFACNVGGHFSQMMALYKLFGQYNSVLVTDNERATRDMPQLKNVKDIEVISSGRENVKPNRSSRVSYLYGYLRSFFILRKVWKKYRPKVIVSTGSNVAVPLFWIGKFYGSKLIFIETRAKVYTPSLTGRLVRRFADQIYVQWPEMMEIYPEAKYCGTLV